MSIENEKELLEIKGTVENIVFNNESSGFTVLEINTGEVTVTVVGEMPTISEGEELRVVGNWTTHPSFGMQFRATMCERQLPTTTVAIYKFLASGAVKGIGPATADKIVKAFGENTFEVMENEPQRLTEIRGITSKKAEKMVIEFKNMFGTRQIMIYLGQFGISPVAALKVYKVWGANSVDRIKDNPYLLCTENFRIGFDKADDIAVQIGKNKEDGYRIRAGILYVMQYNLTNGHTCLPRGKVVEVAVKMLDVSSELIKKYLQELIDDSSLVLENMNGKEFLFTPYLNRNEKFSASRLLLMMSFAAQKFENIEQDIENVEKTFNIKYESLQKKAITQALSKGLLILTGGPGTGKTTTLNGIIYLLKSKGLKVLLTAPTGRAAKRMSEVTGEEAKTIHRALEVEWDKEDRQVFSRNEKNLLDCDALIVDEVSMVDSVMFSSLLKALPLGCRLILVGDSDQLPSVGAGNVLHDLILSNTVPTVELQEVFRQSMQSLIVSNAHKIVRGEMPDLTRKDNDFFFLSMSDSRQITQTVLDLCNTRLPNSYGYSPMSDIQVLTPSRKGELGVNQLNISLQEVLNPPNKAKKEIKIGNSLFRQGDKVMQMKNDYDIIWGKADGTSGTGVFNGDVGILQNIDKAVGEITINFEDKIANYTLDQAENIDLAYATTVHKSQGNEFQAVIIPMFSGPPMLHYRNLLYTAVTRARSLLILVGMQSIIYKMVENDRKTLRYTGLRYFLKSTPVINNDELIEKFEGFDSEN